MKEIKTFFDCFVVFIVIGWCTFSIVNMGFMSIKMEKFIDNYKKNELFNKQIVRDTIRDELKLITIKGNWLISLDPNHNWIHFQYDPNFIDLGLKEK